MTESTTTDVEKRLTAGLSIQYSFYPVFNKAAHALGLNVRQLISSVEYRADLAALEAAITDNTIMLLGGSFLMTQDGPERLDKAAIALVEVAV